MIGSLLTTFWPSHASFFILPNTLTFHVILTNHAPSLSLTEPISAPTSSEPGRNPACILLPTSPHLERKFHILNRLSLNAPGTLVFGSVNFPVPVASISHQKSLLVFWRVGFLLIINWLLFCFVWCLLFRPLELLFFFTV